MTRSCNWFHSNWLEKNLCNYLERYSAFVARNPLWFIITPLIITGLAVPGIFIRNRENNIRYLYTPSNAKSLAEAEVINSRWPIADGWFSPSRSITDDGSCKVTVAPRNDSHNVLSEPYLTEIVQLNFYVHTKIVIFKNGMKFTYKDLCLRTFEGNCYSNELMTAVHDLWILDPDLVTYPNIKIFAEDYYLASSLGGVLLRNDSVHLHSAKGWILLYGLRYDPEFRELSKEWELEFEKAMLNYYSTNLTISFFHSQTLQREFVRSAQLVVPKFSISVGTLMVFCGLCTLRFVPNTWYIDWCRSSPLFASLGVINALLAAGATIGLLTYVGCTFISLVTVMPFLVVSIGVDDMFLIQAAFERTDRNRSVEERISGAVREVAISILITTITDALSFAVGAITVIPAVQIFCIYTAAGIIMTFIFGMSFLLGNMVIFARLEACGRHSSFILPKVRALDLDKSIDCITKALLMGTVVKAPFKQDYKSADLLGNKLIETLPESRVRRLSKAYAGMLLNGFVQIIIVLWFFIYLATAIWGTTMLKRGLEPRKLLVGDSYANEYYDMLAKYFWPYGQQVQIVVNNPPNLASEKGRDEAWKIANRFTNTTYTMGAEGLSFWLSTYVDFLDLAPNGSYLRRSLDADETFFMSYFKDRFLNKSAHKKWVNDVKFYDDDDHNPYDVEAYRFTLGMRNFHDTNHHQATIEKLRTLASTMPEYNVTTFYVLWYFIDQYQYVLPTTLQNVGIALCCMVIISLLIIPDYMVAICVVLAIVSIDIGVVGFMAHWDLALDIVSMITLIMSIGFSVDFSAHISYSYVTSNRVDLEDRLADALQHVGLPILQGAGSTLLGTFPLAFVDAYLITAFAKTVCLVILFGALHGLVFLPLLLVLCIPHKNNLTQIVADVNYSPHNGMSNKINSNRLNR